jgi:hypothetical protein
MDMARRKRTHEVLLRLSDEDRAMLERLAERWGVSLSGVLRRLIREEHERQSRRR